MFRMNPKFLGDQWQKNQKKTKYHLFEIVLHVQDETQEPQVRQKAQGLVEFLAKGTPFSGVAQQFSQASSRIHRGDIGWVLEDEMVDEGVAPHLCLLYTSPSPRDRQYIEPKYASSTHISDEEVKFFGDQWEKNQKKRNTIYLK